MRSQHPTDVLERENEALRRFLDEKDRREKPSVTENVIHTGEAPPGMEIEEED